MSLPRVYFEKLLESSPDIVVAVDREGAIVFYNDGARQTLGYASDEVLGKPVTLIYPTLDEAKRVMRALRAGDHGEEGKVRNFETVFTARDGERIPVAISGTIIRDERGEPVGSIGFAKDLRQIRRRDRLITLGELAVSLAHEINNPLEVITNTMELLEAFVRRAASDEDIIVEGERFEVVGREIGKVHAIIDRVEALAAGEKYETRQYLPGTLMTDLRRADSPRVEDASAPVAREGNACAAGEAARDRGGPLTGLRILVVDDDLGICRSLAELLRHQRCEVAIASSALQALAIIAERPFDLVLSDVVMHDMDGYDLYMELRDRRPDLPVILMTGYLYDRDHVIKRSKLAGLEPGVLYKKPIDPERLMNVIAARCRPKRIDEAERQNAHGQRSSA